MQVSDKKYTSGIIHTLVRFVASFRVDCADSAGNAFIKTFQLAGETEVWLAKEPDHMITSGW
jgi:hypothetical protein